jgi:hypothetical protein
MAPLAPGATGSLSLKISVANGVSNGTSKSVLVTAVSKGIKFPPPDAVKATVTVG